jgi:hypothetical protein
MQAQFEKMGASLKELDFPANRHWTSPFRLHAPAALQTAGRFTVDVRRGTFMVTKDPDVLTAVVDSRPKDRHLLLMVKAGRNSQKFLCGHDERDWFVASVPTNVASVDQAKDSLRPAPVTEALLKAGVRTHKRHKRHNKAFIRQGEWFFVPAPDLVVSPLLILKNEPLRRADGVGKSHMIEELFRRGGDTVYVHPQHAPGGVTRSQMVQMIPKGQHHATGWTQMARNPEAYARGAVKHPDHATIRLSGWHRIHMNGEVRTRNLGFLD